jgi:F0F1-type ATP synthase membrane subunit b/b'
VGAAAFASEEATHMQEEGVPTAIISHLVNLVVFLSVLGWALFKKARVHSLVGQKRHDVQAELLTAKEELSHAEIKLSEVKQKVQSLQEEARQITKRAEAQASAMLEKMKLEAQSLVKRIVDDSKVGAEQELRRMKEKVIEEIVTEAVERSAENFRTQLESKKDEALIQKELQGLEGQAYHG